MNCAFFCQVFMTYILYMIWCVCLSYCTQSNYWNLLTKNTNELIAIMLARLINYRFDREMAYIYPDAASFAHLREQHA